MTIATPGRRVLSMLERRLEGSRLAPFELELADGSRHRVGNTGRDVGFRLRIKTRDGMRALASLDEAAIGEAYVNGHFDIEGDFMAALDLRDLFSDRHPLHRAWRAIRPLLVGRVRTDKKLAARHYDHGNEFYFAFLDQRYRLYSQALYTSEDESLEQAAENKLDYIYEVCRLGPGRRVLDVGGGWGSFAGYAGARGTDVTMLTISRNQYDYLQAWCRSHDLPSRRDVVLENIYAFDTPRRFDAVVILGVMEHLPDYAGLLARLDRLLEPNGRVYMDFSAAREKHASSTFTHRYVFQGYHSPVHMPQLMAAVNASPFEIVAVHNDRHSYFLTLRQWARNLEAVREEVVRRFGERTFRIFQTYLWGGAHNMQRKGRLESYRVVFQKSVGRPSSGIGVYRPV